MAVEQPSHQTDGRELGIVNRVRRTIKPWYIYALIGTVIVTLAVVLPAVLVTRHNHRKTIEEEQKAPSDPSKARVNLGYAQYQGSLVSDDNGVAQYLGMRYAAPPTGDRRWRAPVEPEVDDSGDQAADTFGPICLGTSQLYPNGGVEDEDCLYANVWAPANATLDSKLPVWLFIQGGGYVTNSNANWNGTFVVERSKRNIVFVNFNYRVGLFGFLASERVRANGAGDLNVGLLDQIALMRWVKRYIPQFGGDPDHVVITGTSAGAGSVALHLLISHTNKEPDGKLLFVGGVGESVFFPAQPAVADLEWQFDRLLSQTSCDGDSDPMSCLRGIDTATLQTVNVPSPFPGRPNPPAPLPLFYWTPCIDGTLLRDLPYLQFSRGEYIDVPLIMGTTTDEGTVFASNASTSDDMATFMQDNYPNLTSEQASSIVDQYPIDLMPAFPLHGPWFPSAAAAYGEATFICPATHVLSSYVSHLNTTRAWGYRYNVYDAINAAQGIGVPHIFESWAVYGPNSQMGIGGAPESYYSYAAGVVHPVMDYWTSFVRTLDPNTLRTPGAPAWEAWGTGQGGRRLLMEAGDSGTAEMGNFTMETVPSEQRARCEFWEGLVPATQQKKV
ncbi:alpha/beta-hydrolase [Hypoxylon sp. FL1857]|nr:alpha/beta-hydrolase [Hypoxylon sp. FL1857]